MPLPRNLLALLLAPLLFSCSTIRELIEEEPCPRGMVLVLSQKNKAVCIDRYEYTDVNREEPIEKAYPLANLNFYECKEICQKAGKRVPSHREWLKACEGTDPVLCNIHRRHPVLRMRAQDKSWLFLGKDCKDPKNMWRDCLKDTELNELPESLAYNEEFPDCRSNSGAVHMVGNLGEWVEDTVTRKQKILGRFNGGLYPQIASSCNYTTIAHGQSYKDYSIGCRCALDVIL